MQEQHAFGEESWFLPLNGLTKFPEDVTVGVGIYGICSAFLNIIFRLNIFPTMKL
jgi:hypothetical protein